MADTLASLAIVLGVCWAMYLMSKRLDLGASATKKPADEPVEETPGNQLAKLNENQPQQPLDLKRAVNELVLRKRSELERDDQATHNAYRKAAEKFAALRASLQELAESLDNNFVEFRIGESECRINVGRMTKFEHQGRSIAGRESDLSFKIEPNLRYFGADHATYSAFPDFAEEDVDSSARAPSLLPGFRMHTSRTFRYPDYDVHETERVFGTEQEVLSHIVEAIADKIAQYEHIDARVARIHASGSGDSSLS